jgi:arabinofuranan 3-O-arabinosyltransferase
VPGPAEHATPARVRVSTSSGVAVIADVGARGELQLSSPLAGRSFRLTVLATRPARQPERRLRSVAIAEMEGSGVSVSKPGGARRFDSGCGAIRVAGVPARVTGTVATLESGRPLRLRGCGSVTLPAGESSVASEPGQVFRADQVRLASSAPEPVATAAPPRVTDPGEGWNGSRDGVRLALNGNPAWLVLAESWSKGWHAYCTAPGGEERDLGPPEPIDGFAAGWQAPADCASARFAFAPQRAANVAYVISLAAVAAMLVFLLVAEVRRRRDTAPARERRASASLEPKPQADPLIHLPWRWALAAGLAVGLVGGFLFALRAGVVLAPLTVLALRAGVSVRRLLLVAATCIGALPLIYLVFSARDRGGNEFDYPNDLLGAHWVALLAVLCLLAAGLLLAARLRRASASGSRSST